MKRLAALVMALMLLCPVCFASTAQDIRAELDSRQDIDRYVTVPHVGEVWLYVQKNLVWYKLIYETRNSPTLRIFGDGGCGPTSSSIVIAALAGEDGLTGILEHAGENGFSLCPHAVNSWSCRTCKERMPIETAEDVFTYLPLVLGSYACGNNDTGSRFRIAKTSGGGTNMKMLLEICPYFGLECTVVENTADSSWIDSIGDGTMAVLLTNTTSSPFTGGAHYVAVVSADEDYIYFMDPMAKTEYKSAMVEIMEKGLSRVRRTEANYKKLHVAAVYLVSNHK